MNQETLHPGAPQIHRKPVPSHYQPLARDETLSLSFDDPRAHDWRGETTKRTRWRTGKDGNEDTVEPRAMVHEIADEPLESNETPKHGRRRRHTLLAWWPEVVWCVVSVACIAVLVSVLSVYNDKPLPRWPLALTLNTVIAFISTVCRTAFVIPVVEALSQSKWNWFKRHGPRPIKDFQVFDEASRGPWGSLKLLFTLKGRYVVSGLNFVQIKLTPTKKPSGLSLCRHPRDRHRNFDSHPVCRDISDSPGPRRGSEHAPDEEKRQILLGHG